jgi:hypothetical protein
VKTVNSKPKNEIFGAGWDVMQKVLKAGYMAPPLIVNYRWTAESKIRRKIVFYPFVPKTHLRQYKLKPTAQRANYRMYNYTHLNKLPSFILFLG